MIELRIKTHDQIEPTVYTFRTQADCYQSARVILDQIKRDPASSPIHTMTAIHDNARIMNPWLIHYEHFYDRDPTRE